MAERNLCFRLLDIIFSIISFFELIYNNTKSTPITHPHIATSTLIYVLWLESLKLYSLHIVFHICLAGFNFSWELAAVWKEIKTLGDNVSLYPANYKVEKVRWALQSAKLISARLMRHHTALKWTLVLDGNQQVIFKPSLQ